ncbi:hypothetical protein PUMCH_000959 [Australozyma saopauloensis]|uniref:AP-2 complex subunit alpha n=1 Tax=Australozyma saopauloensis TaxID=291208 RepID=A0AAX4H5V1_9ASCO|nr:hypothetical protein PUMCH_000959 [[Candida] saopauloensis]
MAPQMKGLTQFIMDLRAAQDAAEERKRINVEVSNIRAKFATSLTSYQKKKYVCKLIYIYLLGLSEEVRFGLDQAYDLLSSSNYLEKQLGYLLVSLLLNRTGITPLNFVQELIERTQTHLIRDLRVDSDDINILALLFIASNFNFPAVGHQKTVIITNTDPTAEFWQELIPLVYGLCVSPTSTNLVKKKASVALLALLRLCPSVLITNDNWIPRLLSLIDDTDISLILSAVPLASLLTEFKPSYAKAIMPSVAQRLYSLVVDATCPSDEFYYDTPSPWLVIKLLQLTEHYFVKTGSSDSLDATTVQSIRLVVSRSIQNALVPRLAQTSRNTHSAILFQAVSILTYLDASPDALSGAVKALVQLIDSQETNTRYLALDTLIKLVARSEAKIPFVEHLEKIFTSLHNKDISVRRKTIDLLYIVCDEMSYTQIVNHLLDYYPSSETSLRASISVKIALIAERFATDSTWYVSSMLRLLSISGSTANPNVRIDGVLEGEVWERVAQVIVNNEDLTIKACKYIVNILRKSSGAPEGDSLMKVSAFVLGEFGYKLAEQSNSENEQFGINSQFQILYDSYFTSSLLTRPLILSAFLKFINRFPKADFVPDIMDLLEVETLSLDLEIQNRASEFLKIATFLVSSNYEDVSFAKSLLLPLPPFENKENKLLRQLGSLALVNRSTSSFKRTLVGSPAPNGPDNSENFDEKSNPFFEDEAPKPLPLTPNWYGGYHRMLQYDAGIFYEDQLVKLTYKIQRSGYAYTISFTIINNAARNSGATISAFTVSDISTDNKGEYIVNLTKTPDLTITDRSSMEFEARICDIVENKCGPVISISYKCSGSFNSLRLKIPISLLKGLSGTTMASIDDFKKRWVQIGTLLGVEEGELSGLLCAPHRYNCAFLASTLQRIGFAIVQKTPDNPGENIMITGAGILKTLKSNYGVLISLRSTDLDAKAFQLTVRATGAGLSAIMFGLVQEILSLQN